MSTVPKFGSIGVLVVALTLAACMSSTSSPTPTRPSTTLIAVGSTSTSAFPTTTTGGPVTVSSTPTSAPVVPVKTQVVAKGQFSGLVSGGGWLYSVQFARQGPELARATVVRLDPTSGDVVARSAVLPGADSPIYVDHTLWLIAGMTRGRGRPTGLVALDPMTLRRERFVPENSSLDSLSGSARGLLWAALGCTLVRLDPRTGRSLQVARVEGGTQCSTTMDQGDRQLYVVVGPDLLRGQPPTPTLLLQERNASNGRLIGNAIVPSPPANAGVWVSAVAGNIWAAGGDPGINGRIYYYRASPLRLFSSSNGVVCQAVSSCADGGPGPSLPSTGEFPLVDISGGVVFVASATGGDCFNPRTARLDAIGETGIVSGPIVVTRTGAYGVAATVQPGLGIVRLALPTPCRP
jgi:hypothetical protein